MLEKDRAGIDHTDQKYRYDVEPRTRHTKNRFKLIALPFMAIYLVILVLLVKTAYNWLAGLTIWHDLRGITCLIDKLVEGIMSEQAQTTPEGTKASKDFINPTTSPSIDPLRRASWKEAAIDGAFRTFGLVVTGANGLYATACTGTFLSSVGITGVADMAATLRACTVAGIPLITANWASSALNNYGLQSGR